MLDREGARRRAKPEDLPVMTEWMSSRLWDNSGGLVCYSARQLLLPPAFICPCEDSVIFHGRARLCANQSQGEFRMALSRFALSSCLLASGLFISPLLAQTQPTTTDDEQQPVQKQQVIVTATRIDTPQSQVGNSVTVIESQQIEQRQDQDIADVLQHVPGVHVRTSGGRGSQVSIFMRGTESDHTLLLLDGIKIHDVAAPGGVAIYDHLSTTGLDRIEVLRGPQSTLYGTEAIGGVISATTKRGDGPTNGYYSIETGSYKTTTQKLYVGGGEDKFNYAIAATRVDSDMFSASDNDTENDPYRSSSFHSRFGFQPMDEMNLDVVFHYIQADTELDGSFYDSNSYQTNYEQYAFKVEPSFYLMDGQWETKLILTYNTIDRDSKDDVPSFGLPSGLRGRNWEADWQNTLFLSDNNTLVFGIVHTDEQAQLNYPGLAVKTYSNDSYSLYVQDQLHVTEDLTFNAGLRYINDDQFGDKLTYQLAGAYHFAATDTTLRASIGTGFKAPSLQDLYNDQYNYPNNTFNNPDLKPEESLGWDVGLEQPLFNDKLNVGATYFYNDIKNLINFVVTDPNFATYAGYTDNIDKARTQGVEAFIQFKPAKDLMITFNYTYTDTQDMSTGHRLLRRPLHSYNFDVTKTFMQDKAHVTLSVMGASQRDEYGGAYADAYVTVNLAGSYKINQNVEIFARIENLLNEQYQDVDTYNTADASAYAGVKITF
jgi:vitamin B12 transporter